ncbi:MAG: DNA repair protein RecO [Alphaproteobacteria bacterium]|nr:DNA repair protein RecO [Alphaproteobacteria bacterium]
MQEWRDEAFLLSARPLGERGVVAHVLSRSHGRCAGLIHGGQAQSRRGWLQPGARLEVSWRARLAEQLGHFVIEPLISHGGRVLSDPDRLAALASALALLDNSLAERDPHPEAFASLETLLQTLDSADDWGAAYLEWECRLLSLLGYGLPRERFAEDDGFLDLENWSVIAKASLRPRSCLALPGMLCAGARHAGASRRDLGEALSFLATLLAVRVFRPLDRDLPAARYNLLNRFGVGLAEV